MIKQLLSHLLERRRNPKLLYICWKDGILDFAWVKLENVFFLLGQLSSTQKLMQAEESIYVLLFYIVTIVYTLYLNEKFIEL